MKLRITGTIFSIACLCASSHTLAAAEPAPWSYVGSTGADKWGELDPDYALCRSGKNQSPLNINSEMTRTSQLPALDIHFTAGPATVRNYGYTLEVQSETEGYISLKSDSAADDYTFVQLHFHTPSEEQINGKAYPLVAHMVHRNTAGKLAVVATFFEEGAESEALAPLLAIMPRHKNEVLTLGNFNVADLFPKQRDYYTYEGSLTTPPCTEGVRWLVLKTPLTLSKEQLTTYQLLFAMNARPVQPLNNRHVLSSD